MLQFDRTAAAVFSYEGCALREKPLPAILPDMMQFQIGGRPKGLIHNNGLPFINPQLLQLPPPLKVIALLRQFLFILLATDQNLGEAVLLDDQFKSFPTSIQKNFVVQCEYLPHLYVEFDSMAIVGVADVDIVDDIELIASDSTFFTLLQYFHKADLELVLQLLCFRAENTSDLLLAQVPHSYGLSQRRNGP